MSAANHRFPASAGLECLPMRLLLAAIGLGFLSGCVAHDSRIKELRPQRNGLSAFEGTYSNEPVHVTVSGGMPSISDIWMYVSDYDETIRRDTEEIASPVDRFSIAVDKDQNLVVTGKTEGGLVAFETTLEQDAAFRLGNQGRLLFDRAFDPHCCDLLAFGIGTERMTWLIDQDGNLAVMPSTAFAGALTIIPLVIMSKSLIIYPRTGTQGIPARSNESAIVSTNPAEARREAEFWRADSR